VAAAGVGNSLPGDSPPAPRAPHQKEKRRVEEAAHAAGLPEVVAVLEAVAAKVLSPRDATLEEVHRVLSLQEATLEAEVQRLEEELEEALLNEDYATGDALMEEMEGLEARRAQNGAAVKSLSHGGGTIWHSRRGPAPGDRSGHAQRDWEELV
jgi:hypothetical protein